MKKTALILLALCLCAAAEAQNKVIENPEYTFKNTGLYDITRIELNDDATRLYVKTTFIPGWWVSFSQTDYIEDAATGKKYYAVAMENGEFDMQIPMPPSGDSLFVLIFPALDKDVKAVTFGENDKPEIFDISLEKSRSSAVAESSIPAGVSAWIEKELAANAGNPVWNPDEGNFFKDGIGRLVGYLKGYDPRAGFKTGIIYIGNSITNEDYPIVVEIHPDGRFEADIPMIHPQRMSINFLRTYIPIYMEPGQTLALFISWEDFLLADRHRNIRYKFSGNRFEGPLADINRELLAFEPTRLDYSQMREMGERLSSEELYAEYKKVFDDNMSMIGQAADSKTIGRKTRRILEAGEWVNLGTSLLDYDMNLHFSGDKPAPDRSFFDFLKDMPLDDPILLADNGSGIFINRFEFSSPFSGRYKAMSSPQPAKTFTRYLAEDLGIELSEEQLEAAQKVEAPLVGNITQEKIDQLKADYAVYSELFGDYMHHRDAYTEEYITPFVITQEEGVWRSGRFCDSIVSDYLGLHPNLIYDISKVRQLEYEFGMMDKESAADYLADRQAGIGNAFLNASASKIFEKVYPAGGKKSYRLPEGTATDIFRKITDPFKGRLLVVDFWATTCGPCVFNIKQMNGVRKEYEKRDDMAFLFITDMGSSPEKDYNDFVNEQELVNTYRLPEDDYNYLRQLFRFNGIPHYVLIEANGDAVDIHSYGLEEQIKPYLE